MRKSLISILTLGSVAAVAIFATGAFFSDTETSVGNKFVAGALDLKIDNESYAIDYNIPGYQDPIGALVASTHTSWELADLTIQKFFDFVDLKPGDYGEDTISVHVENDAWVCAAAKITEDLDNSITEPEDEVSGPNNDANDGTADGDLDSELQFAFWVDDGDNVLESCESGEEECLGNDETQDIFLGGTLASMGQAGQIALADSANSILGGNEPIPGGTTFYIAKAWCYGALTPDPLEQDGEDEGRSPVDGTGVDCDGSGPGNIGQTDSVVGDLQFYAEQARNNSEFLCENWDPSWPAPTPVPPTPTQPI